MYRVLEALVRVGAVRQQAAELDEGAVLVHRGQAVARGQLHERLPRAEDDGIGGHDEGLSALAHDAVEGAGQRGRRRDLRHQQLQAHLLGGRLQAPQHRRRRRVCTVGQHGDARDRGRELTQELQQIGRAHV